MTRSAKALLPAAIGMAVAFGGPAAAQTAAAGADAYRMNCAQCHGAGARGDGPLREFLTVPPADLTLLRQRNNNEFPFYRTFLIVDGRSGVRAHGNPDMPAWGPIFALGAERYGPYGAETYIRGRIVELVMYLETLQR